MSFWQIIGSNPLKTGIQSTKDTSGITLKFTKKNIGGAAVVKIQKQSVNYEISPIESQLGGHIGWL